ncbi:leucine-rich repeat domain-containing protein [Geminocystis sp. NIES-3709]|uniref:leucine-rich repeat domain-containing protein n=1 Tax=Geminocystis sp. NIES-3709 TaxID=1617448 RepID=UPI0005FC996E|nr:leucine-rich repeat domain-containing protein [Geminocystis sp. NIES-3709]BAQ63672.1 internalin [Geminocystis sp. NIES-3709]
MSLFKFSLIVGFLATNLSTGNAIAQHRFTIAQTNISITSFSDWCSQEKSLPEATQKTINAIVKSLRVENCQQAAEIVPKVFSINISSQEISDLRPLASFINISELTLYDNEIVDISPLKSMINLKKLILGHNQISDLTTLNSLTNLEKLYISDNKIDDIKPLSSLTKLQTIYINENNVSDLQPLNNLTNLRELYANNNKIFDLTPLSNLTNLQELYLDKNEISNLSPLSTLKNLEELSLNNNKITDSDIESLWDLDSLKQLYIHDNPVSRQFCPNNKNALCFIGNR